MGPLRDTYRHGALREAAVEAAYDLALSGGLKGVTLRGVAERVGVAHRSLYNHFADRDSLLDAVAERGFRESAVGQQAAPNRADYVRAYVGYALANPGLHEVMCSRPHATMKYRPGLRASVHLGLTEARRLFGDPTLGSAENRRRVMKVVVLLQGGLAMRGILDVDGDEGLIAELTAMAEAG